ncbi:MAG: MauE/DoxX family redox-associated membrane protein [Luteolibacter sp.]
MAISLRVALGAWFVFSGGMKLFVGGIDRFERDISNYGLIDAPWTQLAAVVVPCFEMVSGLCLLLGCLRKGAILVLATLVGVFATAIAWAWYHQLDIACGCHGGDAKIHYWGKSAELLAYWIILAWLWRADRHQSITASAA